MQDCAILYQFWFQTDIPLKIAKIIPNFQTQYDTTYGVIFETVNILGKVLEINQLSFV